MKPPFLKRQRPPATVMNVPSAPFSLPKAETHCFRPLGAGDRGLLLRHLRRLDTHARRSRFGGEISDEALETYAASALGADDIAVGFFAEGVLRGVAELRLFGADRDTGEAAFSLETEWRGRGKGAELFSRLLGAARERNVRRIVLNCLRDNAAMQRIARRFDGELCFYPDEVTAEIRSWPGQAMRLAA